MPIELTQEKNGKVLEVKVSGTLREEDYQRFVPEFDRLAGQNHKIRMLFVMSQFHGWEVKAAWDDLKLGLKHYNDIERVAVVGEQQWEKGLSVFWRAFTAAELRYFDRADIGAARAWLAEGLDEAGRQST